MSDRIYLAPGELRADLLRMFADEGAPIDVLLAGPGLTPDFVGREQVVSEPGRRFSVSLASAFRQSAFELLAGHLDRLPQTAAWEGVVRSWITALRSGGKRVLHDVHAPAYTRLVSRPQHTLVHPAPVATSTWETRDELNLELRGEAHAAARRWFENRSQRAADISLDVAALLAESWAGELVDPMDIYCKTLTEYFWNIIESMDQAGDSNPMLEQLTEFQVKAYEYAKGILRRYGGVFLADVVGLGKTYIGMALLRHLQDTYDEHAVVIAPPNVCPAWRELAAEHRVGLVTVSSGKLEDLASYSDREVLLVDESHNFRNRGTKRYESLDTWLRPDGSAAWRKVVLLSATPQNNDASDVKHQLAFFPDNHARLPYRGESLDDWFQSVGRGDESLSDLLQHVVVRRTRRFIKAAYPDVRIRVRRDAGRYEQVPLVFPERVSGPEQCLRYAIDATYAGGLYSQILAVLERLHYALYGLGGYVLPRHADDPAVAGIRRAGRAIRGLYRVLLLKRLESSVFAFCRTLEHLQARLCDATARLDAGLVRVRVPYGSQGLDTSEDESLEPPMRDHDVSSALFDVTRLRTHLAEDAAAVSGLLDAVRRIGLESDAKASRLMRWLRERPPASHRTIVFTQFADTARYLGRALAEEFGRTRVVTGSSGDSQKVAKRFAPRANRASVAPEDELDLIISTDAMSEGVNLQDADTLVNYDLHWNPVRLIQRAGRIDRIGSPHDSIWIASFLPEAGLEASLRIEEVLRARSKEFIAVFGEDSDVLPSDDTLDEAAAMSAYSGSALEAADASDDLDGLSRHVERLHRFRREEPERYNRCLAMRAGRRSVSAGAAPALAATRVGWFWTFWRRNRSGELASVPDVEGLDSLERHARDGVGQVAPAQAGESLGMLAEEARALFAGDAAAFREQRIHPKLQPVEQWVLDRLERYRESALESQRGFVEELSQWVREGHAKTRITRAGRMWRREDLSAESVFRELRSLYRRFPPVRESMPDPEVVFSVIGTASLPTDSSES